MYQEALYKELDCKAKWTHTTKATYNEAMEHVRNHDIDVTNIYIRDSLDDHDTEWTGILVTQTGSGIAWFKYLREHGEHEAEYLINQEVLNA